MVATAGETRKSATLFRLEVDHSDPVRAQNIHNSLIDTWVEATKPQPIARARLEEQLQRTEFQLKSVSLLLERFEKEAPSLISSTSLQGEFATSQANLAKQRDQHIELIASIKQTLIGSSSDVVLVRPTLPGERSGPKRTSFAIIAALLTGLLLLGFVLMRHFVDTASATTANKLAEIGAALRPFSRRS